MTPAEQTAFRDWVGTAGPAEAAAVVIELIGHMTPRAATALARDLAIADCHDLPLPTLAELGLSSDRAIIRHAIENDDAQATAGGIIGALPAPARWRLVIQLLSHLEH